MSNNKISSNFFLKNLNKKKHIKNIEKKDIHDFNFDEIKFTMDDLYSKNLNDDNYIPYKILKKFLDSCSSCQISDALQNLTGRNGILKDIYSLNNKKTYGRIVTAKTNSDDWGTSLLAIDKAKKGEILFILSSGNSSAIWGELTSICSKEKNLNGTIIKGASRDIDFIANFDYPVFASNVVPNAGNPLGLGEINISFEFENIKVTPGDFIFADINGCVLIPKEFFSEVIIETLKIKKKENHFISQIKNGKYLSEIVGLK